jgi:hypothetical protein
MQFTIARAKVFGKKKKEKRGGGTVTGADGQ